MRTVSPGGRAARSLATRLCDRGAIGVLWSEGFLLLALSGGVPLLMPQWMWGQGARVGAQDLQEAARRAGA